MPFWIMEKNILAAKIKELRNSKGYSQEYLSEAAQLSLRTVQRLENAESEPHGDTLNRLAKILGVEIDELTELRVGTNNNNYLAIMNLSAGIFIFLQLPFLSFIGPLMLWLYKKDKFQDVYERGKQILNFQITWNILSFFLWSWAIICKISHFPNTSFCLFTPRFPEYRCRGTVRVKFSNYYW